MTSSRFNARMSRSWRAAATLAAVLFAGYGVHCASLYSMQDSMLFPGTALRGEHAPPPAGGERWSIEIGGGKTVEAWFCPAPSATAEAPAPLVIYGHGNYDLIDYQAAIVRAYHAIGCSVLLPEYRGYGRSGGKPSQKAIGDDLEMFHDMAAHRPEVDRARMIFHGRSLGAGVMADLAQRRKPAAIILESSFTSVVAMARRYAVPAFLVRSPYRVDQIVPAMEAPTLIFHGTRDDIIPVSHGRRLHMLMPWATYIEYDENHNDFPGRSQRQFWEAVTTFLLEARVIHHADTQGKR